MSIYPLSYPAGRTMSSVVKWFVDEKVSFLTGTILSSGTAVTYEVGTVLGLISLGAPSAAAPAALGTNSAGNGVFSALSAPAGSAPGTWTLVFLDATHIEVTDPFGVVQGHAVAGTPYAGNGPHFTFTAGGTAQVVGDEFTLAVTYAAGSGKYTPINPAATDGSQNFAAIVCDRAFVPAAGDADYLMLVRQGIVIDDSLIWPAGYTNNQIAAALAQAQAVGVLTKWGV